MASAHVAPQLQFKNILLTTDFSEGSERALQYAIDLAHKHGSKIVVLHALQPEPFTGVPLDPLHESDVLADRKAEREMAHFAESRLFTGLRHKKLIRRGLVEDVVRAVVQENAVDLIVLATHGRTGIKHLVTGSVAEKIFRGAACPVMTIGPHAPAGHSGRLRKVLFATDFSDSAGRALPYAVAIARESGATLVVLHVTDFVFAEGVDFRKEALAAAEALLQEKAPPPEGLVEFRRLARLGTAVGGILSTAHDESADLIVMGLHRHSTVSTHLPWATAHQIVAQARCPVLTVR